ncbi:MAG: copper transporter [bacterium]
MGPIDIRYHVVSLVAVFLAIGVGIMVGSQSNMIGTNAIIDRQNSIIGRLEKNFDDMRQEVKETKSFLKETADYVQTLETRVIPLLLHDKLPGFSFGVAAAGDFQPELNPTEAVAAAIRDAGGVHAFTLEIDLERLRGKAGENTADFAVRLAGEMVSGAASSSSLTAWLADEGFLLKGGFDAPVTGIVFVLGTGLDAKLVETILVPLELKVREMRGIVVNAAAGDGAGYQSVFRTANLQLFTGVETLPGRMELIGGLAGKRRQSAEGIPR